MSLMVCVVSHGLISNQIRGKFVKFLKDNKIGRKDSLLWWLHYLGFSVWSEVTRKENYARTFAKVLGDNGITAYNMSRLD